MTNHQWRLTDYGGHSDALTLIAKMPDGVERQIAWIKGGKGGEKYAREVAPMLLAAPEMLEALKLAIGVLICVPAHEHEDYDKTLEAVDSVLAMVEGE